MPRVSVIIPTYNSKNFLKIAIESVLTQSYQDFEIIVIDDGSTDNTETVIATYGNKIKYIKQNNEGVSNARNKGIKEARGELIAFLDHDDLWLPQKLEKQVALMEREPDLGFSCSGTIVIDKDGQTIDTWLKDPEKEETFDCLYNENFIFTLTVIVRRKCFESVGYFDPSFHVSEDYDLWLRLAKKFKFKYINEPLTKYRNHPGTASKNLTQRLNNNLILLNRKEISGDLPIKRRILRRAKAHYYFANLFSQKGEHLLAAMNYLKSILTWPWIGLYYWPKETEHLRLTFLYRLVKPYCLTIYHLTQGLFHESS